MPTLATNKLKASKDEQLVDLLRTDNKAAFEEIYHRYWQSMYSACYKRIQSGAISEEIIQDIFTSLWINRHLIVINNLQAYLLTGVKYKVINHLARESSRQRYVQEHADTTRVRDNSTEETILLRDLNQALEREIKKLPAKRQMIFRLHRNENLSLKQVATRMGISEKTVENQYGKALKTLKVSLRHFTLIVVAVLVDGSWSMVDGVAGLICSA